MCIFIFIDIFNSFGFVLSYFISTYLKRILFHQVDLLFCCCWITGTKELWSVRYHRVRENSIKCWKAYLFWFGYCPTFFIDPCLGMLCYQLQCFMFVFLIPQAKKEIYSIKEQRLMLAQDEYQHLNDTLSGWKSSKTSCELMICLS